MKTFTLLLMVLCCFAVAIASVTPPPPADTRPRLLMRQWPLTNVVIQSSCDLVHWTTRADATATNAPSYIDFHIPGDGQPHECFRATGQSIPGVTTNIP